MSDAANENARPGDEAGRALGTTNSGAKAMGADFEVNDAAPSAPRKPSIDDMLALASAGHDLVELAPRGKRPVRTDWTNIPADNDAVLAAVRRGANAGVRLRQTDLVVDVDPANGGDASFVRLVRDLGLDLSRCPHVATGSGGSHYYLRRPEGVALVTNLREYPGIDFKSSGQVVAPGSVHPNGRRYESNFFAYSPGEAPDAPPALLSLLERRPTKGGDADRAGELTPRMLAANLAQLDPAEFDDYSEWMNIMMACHHATNGDGLDEFTEWSTSAPGHSDAAEVIAYKWNGLGVDGRGVTVQYLYRLLHDRGLTVHDRHEPEDDFDAVETDDAPRQSRWRFLSVEELESLPPPRWLVPGILVEGSIAAIYGAPESGKSFLAVDLSMSVASGVAWHGRPVEQGGVLYVAAEGAPGLGKRVRAWKVDRSATGRRVAFSLMRDPINMATDAEAREFARTVAAELGDLRLVVVDTLNQTAAGADENSAQDMGRYIAGMKRLRDATGATVVVVHHSGKDESKGMRGSTALLGAMDTTVEVARATHGNSKEVRIRKQKDAEREPPMRFNLSKVADSLVLRATVIADAASDFASDPLREMARDMAASRGGRVALKEVVAALKERDGVADKTARRRIEGAIPDGRAGGETIWMERVDNNPKGEKVIVVEDPGCRAL